MAQKFSIGDHVRITKKRKHLIKDTLKDGRKKFLQISKIQLTIPVTYKISDSNVEEIQGSFYEQELQKTKQDIFRIANIIKQQEIIAMLTGWAIMNRLTRVLITKTLTNYRAKVHNVCNCVAWPSQVFTNDNAL